MALLRVSPEVQQLWLQIVARLPMGTHLCSLIACVCCVCVNVCVYLCAGVFKYASVFVSVCASNHSSPVKI